MSSKTEHVAELQGMVEKVNKDLVAKDERLERCGGTISELEHELREKHEKTSRLEHEANLIRQFGSSTTFKRPDLDLCLLSPPWAAELC